MSRLASEFWVKAYLKTLSLRGISAFVTSRGDDQAGAILIKLAPLDGTSTLYQKGFDFDTGAPTWTVLAQGDESEVDAMIARQRSFDPDLWVLEVENPLNDAHLIDPQSAVFDWDSDSLDIAAYICPMEWRDQGILLGTTPFGETAVIVDALTQKNGRVRAVLRGGQSRKFRPILQVGNFLDITWRARLSEHMGSVQVDLIKSYPEILDSRLTLAGVAALSSMLTTFVEDRDPQAQMFDATEKLYDLLIHPDMWCVGYFYWELALLEALGFGLDLSKCVVTGDTENLLYLSPKSGCAVSRHAAGEWADRLLPMPRIVIEKDKHISDVFDGLQVLSYFWLNKVIPALGVKTMPKARERFIDIMQRHTVV